jgi:hypothetical protein
MKVQLKGREKICLIPIRPVDQYRTALGHHLRAERERIGLTSAEAFVDYLEETTGLPNGALTPRMVYNLEAAKSNVKVEMMPLTAIACFAENLFLHQPSTQYLINPRTKKPFTANELLYILYGWICLETGEEIVKIAPKK